MDNNVAKNRFFSRSFPLDLTKPKNDLSSYNGILDKISLKKNILEQVQNAIRQRFTAQIGNPISPKLVQVLTSLSDKVILQDNSDMPSLVYSCAIAFPLANLFRLSSLQAAQELVSLLTKNYQESTGEFSWQFTVRVKRNGLIELSLSDRAIGLWLSAVWEMWRWRNLEDGEMGRERSLARGGDGEIGDYNIFPVQYVYHRCCSLLHLGEREGLINLKDDDFHSYNWQIKNSNPFKYYCEENIGYRYESAELNLLRQISVIIDFISDRGQNFPDPKTWFKLALNLSDACLNFIAACRIFGSVAQDNRDLAIARLGLIAVVQWCLQIFIKP